MGRGSTPSVASMWWGGREPGWGGRPLPAPLPIECVGADPILLNDVYPFLTIIDIKRLIWIAKNGDARWAPERVFLGVRKDTTVRPLEFHWPAAVSDSFLPDPTGIRTPNPGLVTEAGERKPVKAIMTGSLTLETALSPELQQIGRSILLVAIPLMSLREDVIPASLFGGFYQFYFPWLTGIGEVLESNSPSTPTRLKEAYAAALLYTESRTGQIRMVNDALNGAPKHRYMSMTSAVRLRWILPAPAHRPVSLEKVFYGLRANEIVPFLRFFPVSRQAPIGTPSRRNSDSQE